MAKRVTSKALSSELANIGKFQDQQINALQGISDSIGHSSESIKIISDSLSTLEKSIKSMTVSHRSVESEKLKFEESIRRRQLSIQENYNKHQQRLIRSHEDSITRTMASLSAAGQNVSEEMLRNARRSVEAQIEEEEKLMKSHKTYHDSLTALGHQAMKLANMIADSSNRFSQISNNLISVSGANSSDVRATRQTIVHDVIGELNSQTGMYFNAEQSYEKLVSTMHSANIGSLEAMEELARPILLASESMSINTTELSSLLGKWYTRYNFSSEEMETMIDDIRGNTANNNATAEETMQNIKLLESLVVSYSNGDKDTMMSAMDAISEITSRYGSMGVNTAPMMEDLKNLMTGNFTRELITVLNAGGVDDILGLQGRVRSLSPDAIHEFINAYTTGYSSYAGDALKYNVSDPVMNEYGLDPEWGRDLYNAMNIGNGIMSSEEFLQSTQNAETSVESIEGKFISFADKFTNYMSEASEYFAWMQEFTPFAWSDLLSLIAQLGAIMSLSGLFHGRGVNTSSAANMLGNASAALTRGANTVGANLAVGGSALVGNGASTGLALGAGALGAGAGIGMGLYGGYKAYENFSEGDYGVGTSYALGGAAGLGGAIALGLGSGPVGWAALAIGGLTLLGTAAYENAHELRGNAKAVSEQIEAIEDSMKKENLDRLMALTDLDYQFDQLSTYEEKRALLAESGLISQEKLEETTNEALDELIESYKNAASAINASTDTILKTVEEHYQDKLHGEQTGFVDSLSSLWTDPKYTNDDRYNVLSMLREGTTDEKLIEKITKAQSDNDITQSEWGDIIYGGANSWFDKHNLEDQSIDALTMQTVARYLGLEDTTFTDPANSKKAAEIYSQLKYLYSVGDKSAFAALLASSDSDIVDIGSVKTWAQDLGIKGYATGSNYISHNQLALIHEGEAVVPKRYNPAANATELEMLRKYYQESANRENGEMIAYMREFAGTLAEIKEFLALWKDDNARKDMINRNTATTPASIALSHYKLSY